jgi:hypothetical protein
VEQLLMELKDGRSHLQHVALNDQVRLAVGDLPHAALHAM